jgi:hypothetical protein
LFAAPRRDASRLFIRQADDFPRDSNIVTPAKMPMPIRLTILIVIASLTPIFIKRSFTN